MSSSSAPEGRSMSAPRAIYYHMTEDGTWKDDQGPGCVTLEKVSGPSEMDLYFTDDENCEELFLHSIGPEGMYKKQEDTIMWRDPLSGTYQCLSFEETAGCFNIWSRIRKVQMSSQQTKTLNNEKIDEADIKVLHTVELSTLPSILEALTEYKLSEHVTLIGIITEEQGFLKELMELFRTCEEEKNVDGLHMIFRIVQAILLLNHRDIFQFLFDDKWAMDIFGCLEYNPKETSVVRHRYYAKNHMLFDEAIPIKDPLTLLKMHEAYRLCYLKEAIVHELDEETVQTIDYIVHENNAKVISMLKDDNGAFQELLTRLRSSATSVESKQNLVCFLHGLFKLIKSIDISRDSMIKGLFYIIAEILQSPDRTLVQTGVDIITGYLQQDPNLLIKTYIKKPEGRPFLGLLVKGFITDFGDGIHCQFLHILYTLLDPAIKSEPRGKTMIDIFCEKHLSELIDVITSSCPLEGAAQSVVSKSVQNNVKPATLLNICELICFCVQHNTVVIMCHFLCNNAIYRVLSLTRRRETYLVAASIRFMRTILTHQDSILTAYVIKNNLLQPIVVAFVTNGNRYNLLHSAALEFFELFCDEKMSSLVTHLVDTFWGELVQFEHLSSIRMLKSNYDKYHDDDAAAKRLDSNMEEVSFSEDRRGEGYLSPQTTKPSKISDGEEEMLEKFTTDKKQ